MTKLKNFIKNITGLALLAVFWVFYAPYAMIKALVDIDAFKDFLDDIMTAVANLRFEAGKAFRRRSTHNAVINECMKNLQKCEELKDIKGNIWLGIQKFLKDQYE